MKAKHFCSITGWLWWQPSVLVAVIPLLSLGCNGPKGRPAEDAMIDTVPGISVRASEINVEPIESGTTLRLNDFIMVLPRGWGIDERHDRESGDVSLAIRALRDGQAVFPVYVGYEETRGVVSDPPDAMFDVAEQYVGDANTFFDGYDTDLEFLLEIANVTPDDRDKACGAEHMRLKLLLYYKRNLQGGINARHLKSDKLHAIVVQIGGRANKLGVRVFDKKGEVRAALSLDSEKSGADAQELLGALLANSLFAERASDADGTLGSALKR